MATTIFTPSMLRNGTRGVPEIPHGGGGGGSLATVSNEFSMDFDRAAGTYMTTGINIAADSNFSVSFWVKGGVKAGFTNNNAFGIGGGGNTTPGRLWNNKFIIQSYDNAGANFGNRVVDIDIYDGDWHHLVFTRDNSTGQYFAYTAGANVQWIGLFGASNAPSITLNPSGDLYLGTAGGSTTYSFDGKVDEFALFDYTLDTSTIELIYSASLPLGSGVTADLSKLSTPPVAWYRMGD
jgi:hypothetical protein